MRTIKFRGKRISNKEWVYGNLVIGTYLDGELFAHIEDATEKEYRKYCVLRESIGEFTGLKDKNGKEIYEGDILKFIRWSNELQCRDEFVAKVTFENCMFYADYELRLVAQEPTREIIGNVYENPELIKEKLG